MSDLIIEGTVKDANAFLSEDQTGVYSELTVSVGDLMKASTSEPVKASDVITTDRFGGRPEAAGVEEKRRRAP
jgi:hypothetical protein